MKKKNVTQGNVERISGADVSWKEVSRKFVTNKINAMSDKKKFWY